MDAAQKIISFLAPFLPYLVKAGGKAVEEIGEKLGESTWELAQRIWAKLRPKMEAKPSAREVVRALAQNPSDEGAQAALRFQLRNILAQDEALTSGLVNLLNKNQAAGSVNVSQGNSGIVMIGFGNGQQVIQQGPYNVNIGEAQQVTLGGRRRSTEVREVHIDLRLSNGKYPTHFWIDKIGEMNLLFGLGESNKIIRDWWEPSDYSEEQLHQVLLQVVNRLAADGWEIIENDLEKVWITESNHRETVVSSIGDLIRLPVGISWKNWRVYRGARFHVRRILDAG